mmetsp:Transcript_5287/g.21791  ORF Transcript_5287/g.21791 Transcript_5287/m.21791 type:complete len:314 (+) Transcript_5287:2063-3004(+)
MACQHASTAASQHARRALKAFDGSAPRAPVASSSSSSSRGRRAASVSQRVEARSIASLRRPRMAYALAAAAPTHASCSTAGYALSPVRMRSTAAVATSASASARVASSAETYASRLSRRPASRSPSKKAIALAGWPPRARHETTAAMPSASSVTALLSISSTRSNARLVSPASARASSAAAHLRASTERPRRRHAARTSRQRSQFGRNARSTQTYDSSSGASVCGLTSAAPARASALSRSSSSSSSSRHAVSPSRSKAHARSAAFAGKLVSGTPCCRRSSRSCSKAATAASFCRSVGPAVPLGGAVSAQMWRA